MSVAAASVRSFDRRMARAHWKYPLHRANGDAAIEPRRSIPDGVQRALSALLTSFDVMSTIRIMRS